MSLSIGPQYGAINKNIQFLVHISISLTHTYTHEYRRKAGRLLALSVWFRWRWQFSIDSECVTVYLHTEFNRRWLGLLLSQQKVGVLHLLHVCIYWTVQGVRNSAKVRVPAICSFIHCILTRPSVCVCAHARACMCVRKSESDCYISEKQLFILYTDRNMFNSSLWMQNQS